MAIKSAIPMSLERWAKPGEGASRNMRDQAERMGGEILQVVHLPIASWEEISVEEAEKRYEADEPLMIRYLDLWNVPSGHSGLTYCWAYHDRLGLATSGNWRAWGPSTERIFEVGCRFMRPSA